MSLSQETFNDQRNGTIVWPVRFIWSRSWGARNAEIEFVHYGQMTASFLRNNCFLWILVSKFYTRSRSTFCSWWPTNDRRSQTSSSQSFNLILPLFPLQAHKSELVCLKRRTERTLLSRSLTTASRTRILGKLIKWDYVFVWLTLHSALVVLNCVRSFLVDWICLSECWKASLVSIVVT